MREIYGKQVCETLDEVLDPEGCAVLVIDVQKDAMLPEGKFARGATTSQACRKSSPGVPLSFGRCVL